MSLGRSKRQIIAVPNVDLGHSALGSFISGVIHPRLASYLLFSRGNQESHDAFDLKLALVEAALRIHALSPYLYGIYLRFSVD